MDSLTRVKSHTTRFVGATRPGPEFVISGHPYELPELSLQRIETTVEPVISVDDVAGQNEPVVGI